MILLVVFSTATLAAYFLIIIQLFRGDRLAYVFDSSRTISSSLSAQVRLELSSWLNELKIFTKDVDTNRGSVGNIGRHLFRESERLDAIWIYHLDRNGNYVQAAQLKKENLGGLNTMLLENKFPDLIKQTRSSELAIKVVDLSSNPKFNCNATVGAPRCEPVILFSVLFGSINTPNHHIALAMVRGDSLIRIFRGSFTHEAYLLDPSGKAVLGLDPLVEGSVSDFSSWPFFRKVRIKNISEGAEETRSTGNIPMLVSYAQVGVGNLMVISLVKKSVALRALQLLLWKSGLFFIALVALAIIVSVFISSRVTSTLVELFNATRRITKGDYSVRLNVKSNDEIGSLAESFNTMASAVSSLIKERGNHK